ncbi:hypothetical protein QR665_14200 [Acinetobacter gerneri]|uniref:hypothetical protein n=1 Tax=Acinetobacter gerneri TaxID=202952 RepID=UPI002935AEEC|nr:hypothetical protein [Acinetobacter gerneri]MDV2440611.1 hypothetical protein [Acinetobacter gerneri]
MISQQLSLFEDEGATSKIKSQSNNSTFDTSSNEDVILRNLIARIHHLELTIQHLKTILKI